MPRHPRSQGQPHRHHRLCRWRLSEIWREAAYNGANVVVRITHYMNPWEEPWKLTNRCAAYCNQVYVVGANCYGMEHACAAFGNSMIVNPDGNIVTEAPMMVPYLLKADLYPGLVDKLHESSTTNTFLYSFRHRGAACKELGGHGETRNQYKAYTFGGDENDHGTNALHAYPALYGAGHAGY